MSMDNSGSVQAPERHPLVRFSRALDRGLTFAGMVGSWLAIPLIFIIIFDIVTRRFLVLGSTKLQEMEWHLHAALFLLALGFGYLRNSHVRIEVVRERFSQLWKARLEVTGITLFLIPYAALVIWFGLDFAQRSFSMDEVSSALTGLSHRWIIKSFVPFGMLLLLAAGVAVLLRNLAYLMLLETGQTAAALELSKSLPELRNPEEELRAAAAQEAQAIRGEQ